MRPTTVLALVAAGLLGAGGIAVGVVLIALHHHQHAQWNYWLAPVLMIVTALTMWQLTMQYMAQIGKKEMRSRPPARD